MQQALITTATSSTDSSESAQNRASGPDRIMELSSHPRHLSEFFKLLDGSLFFPLIEILIEAVNRVIGNETVCNSSGTSSYACKMIIKLHSQAK